MQPDYRTDEIRIIDVEQGTDAWLYARLSLPTASCFSKILTPANLALSKSAEPYIHELLVEYFSGEPLNIDEEHGTIPGSHWMERGKELEPQAAAAYEIITGIDTWGTGMIIRDGEWGIAGASPDKLVGDEGIVELKCPSDKVHIGYAAESVEGVPRKYRLQTQGQLWVSGRKWNDFMSFHPLYPAVYARTYPDPEVMAKLDIAIPQFCKLFLEMRDRLIEKGFVRKEKIHMENYWS